MHSFLALITSYVHSLVPLIDFFFEVTMCQQAEIYCLLTFISGLQIFSGSLIISFYYPSLTIMTSVEGHGGGEVLELAVLANHAT